MARERTRTNKNGTTSFWVAKYYDAEGIRRERAFDTKAQALRFEKENPAPVRPKPIATGSLTLTEIVERYVADSKIGRDGGDPWAPTTLAKVRNHLTALYSVIPADFPVKNITPAKCRAVRDALLGGGWARSYAQSIWKDFKGVLAHAVACELITVNPAADIVIKNSRQNKTEDASQAIPMPTKDEASKILTTAKQLRSALDGRTKRVWERNWLIPFVLFQTGIRIGELQALRWEAIDFTTNSVTIECSAERDTQRLKSTKTTAGYRTLYIAPSLTGALQEHRQLVGASEFVFPDSKGNVQTYRNMLQRWTDLLKRAGVEHHGFHGCRHYYASRLIEAGVDPKVLQTNMGHQDAAFTLDRYGHLFDDRDSRANKQAIAQAMDMMVSAPPKLSVVK